jgi:site-specific recombinase XerD
MAINKFDAVKVQHYMGHASLSTTERYMHAKSHAGDAAKLEEAFSAA